MSGAGKAPPYSRVTGSVLQAETGLVSFSNLASSGDVQQVIRAEGLHAVVVPGWRDTITHSGYFNASNRHIVLLLHALALRCEVQTMDILVTAVPFPLMSGLHGEEICRSLVLHALWEAEQHSEVQITHTRLVRRPTGRRKESARCLRLCNGAPEV